MRRTSLAFIFLGMLLCSTAFAADTDSGSEAEDEEDYEEEVPDKGFLLIRKKVVETDVVQGTAFTVQVSLHNAGSSAAYDIKVLDDSWPSSHFSYAEESTDHEFDRIGSGASVDFNYTVKPDKATGQPIHIKPATVTYRPEGDSKSVQTAYSTAPIFYVQSPFQTYTKKALAAGTYLSGGLITQPHEWRNMSLFVGLIALSIGGTLSYTKLTDARKQRRHKRALADLSKDQ